MIDTDVLESFAPLLCEMEEQSCELDLDNFIIAGTKLLDVIFLLTALTLLDFKRC
jgi:hypothetical protein